MGSYLGLWRPGDTLPQKESHKGSVSCPTSTKCGRLCAEVGTERVQPLQEFKWENVSDAESKSFQPFDQ